MSAHEGKKIVAAVEEFKKRANNFPWPRMAYALKTRDFGEKHFADAYKYVTDLHGNSVLKIIDEIKYNPQSKLQDRRLISRLIEMMVCKDETGKVLFDQYRPAIYSHAMTGNTVSVFERSFPIILSSNHTEFRFAQRTGEKLDYAHEEFQKTLFMSLILSRTLASVMDRMGDTITSFVLPGKNGFYLGHAASCKPDRYHPSAMIIASNRGGKFELFGLVEENGQILPHGAKVDWSPTASLKVNTFISKREFSHSQSRLYDTFSAILEDPRMDKALNAMRDTYTRGIGYNSEDIQWAEDRFSEIYNTPEWQKEIRFGQRHIPEFNMK